MPDLSPRPGCHQSAPYLATILSAFLVLGCEMCVAASLAAAPPQGDSPPPVVLDMAKGQERPALDLTLDGKGPFRFFLDTGAGGNVVSEQLAARLGLMETGTQRVFSPAEGKEREVREVRARSVGLGPVTLANVPMMAMNLPQLQGMDGVLTVRSLAPRRVTFDFPARRIVIDDDVLRPDEDGVLPYRAVPVIGVTAEIGGRELTLHVDTGSPDGITLPGAMAGAMTFFGDLTVLRTRGPLVVKQGRLKGAVRIGGLRLENPVVQVVDLFPDFGNLGIRFLADKVLIVDQRNGLLRFGVPPSAAPK